MSSSTWRFAANQWETVETVGQNVGKDYEDQNIVSLFGWGTSGWDNENTYYQPYNTIKLDSYYAQFGYGYGPTDGVNYNLSLTGKYAKADWGVYNAISNGGAEAGEWRTLTGNSDGEWYYLLETRNTSYGNNRRFALVKVNGRGGMLLFPDKFSWPSSGAGSEPTDFNSYSSTWNGNYTTDEFAVLETAGCVFLPVAGCRSEGVCTQSDDYGYYWSSTATDFAKAWFIGFGCNYLSSYDEMARYYSFSVRLVTNAN